MNTLTKKQKLSFLGLIFLTIFIFVVAFFQFKLTIYGPFKKTANPNAAKEKITGLLDLRNVDTDKDGLNDFDELYIYKTSPYLEDTDGDNISDKNEIERESDPLCPEGMICGNVPSDDKPSSAKASADAKALADKSEGKELSIDEIKKLLEKEGIDKEMLDNVDDKTLKELYNETIKETGIDPENLSSAEAAGTALTNEEKSILENLTVQKMRTLLLEGGFSEEELNKIDDETLKVIFLQALQNKQN